MTISEAIERADRLMPNQYDREQKVRWLSELDGQAEREVFARCEAPPEGDLTPYDPETDLEKELRIPGCQRFVVFPSRNSWAVSMAAPWSRSSA